MALPHSLSLAVPAKNGQVVGLSLHGLIAVASPVHWLALPVLKNLAGSIGLVLGHWLLSLEQESLQVPAL